MTALGMLACRVTGAADITDSAVTAASRAVLPPIKNDLQMQGIPACLGESALQVPLGFDHVAASGQAPALGQSMDMGIHGEGRHAKSLSHDYACGLVAHTGELFQRIEISRHFTIV